MSKFVEGSARKAPMMIGMAIFSVSFFGLAFGLAGASLPMIGEGVAAAAGALAGAKWA